MSQQPSDRAMEEARNAIGSAKDFSLDLESGYIKNNTEKYHADTITRIALALDAARKVPEGCVRLPDGREPKVLGTLPMTADGCVIGQKAYLWNTLPGAKGRDDDRPMRVCYKLAPIMDPDAYTDGPMKMYSTREAAEAALWEKGESDLEDALDKMDAARKDGTR